MANTYLSDLTAAEKKVILFLRDCRAVGCDATFSSNTLRYSDSGKSTTVMATTMSTIRKLHAKGRISLNAKSGGLVELWELAIGWDNSNDRVRSHEIKKFYSEVYPDGREVQRAHV